MGSRSTGCWKHFLLGALAVTVLALRPGFGSDNPGPVITEVRPGTDGDSLLIEIVGSERLNYLLIEGTDPFTLTLYFLNASFAFPASAPEVHAGVLRAVIPSVVERPDSRLGRLDLVFDRTVPYWIRQDGPRLFVHVTGPGGRDQPVLGAGRQVTDPPASPPPAPTSSASGASPLGTPPTQPPAPASPARSGADPAPAASRAPALPAPPPTQPALTAPAPSPAPPAPRGPQVASPVQSPREPPTPAPSVSARVEPRAVPAKPAPSGTVRATKIYRVASVEAGGEIRVNVEADGPLTYRAFTLGAPPRLVVDFENAAYGLDRETLPVGGTVLERIRSSRFQVTPALVVRIVFDLKELVPYWIEPQARGVVVHIGTGGPQ